MSGKLQLIQAKARNLALSGTFKGWRPIAFTLQFEEDFAEAFDWIYSHSTQEELDSLCGEATAPSCSSLTRHTMASTPVWIRWQTANPMMSHTTVATCQKAPRLFDLERGFRHSRWAYRSGQRIRVGDPEKTDSRTVAAIGASVNFFMFDSSQLLPCAAQTNCTNEKNRRSECPFLGVVRAVYMSLGGVFFQGLPDWLSLNPRSYSRVIYIGSNI